METFGQRLRSLREARGWSQERLGFELGVTGATISKWENNKAEPGLSQLTQIRRIFEVDQISLDWLIDDLVHANGMVAGHHQIAEGRSSYGNNEAHRIAQDSDEVALLARFRLMRIKQRRGLLDLILDD